MEDIGEVDARALQEALQHSATAFAKECFGDKRVLFPNGFLEALIDGLIRTEDGEIGVEQEGGVRIPSRIVTLLLPDRLGLVSPPAVRAIYDDGGLPNGFAFERPRRVVRFDENAVVVERG